MKTRNIIGTSKGYVERVLDSDSSVTPEDVQKYFLSTLKFMALYMEASFVLVVKLLVLPAGVLTPCFVLMGKLVPPSVLTEIFQPTCLQSHQKCLNMYSRGKLDSPFRRKCKS